MEIKVEVLDTRMINGHLIELEHWSTTAANPEHSLSKYTVHDRIYYALGHIIKELSTPQFFSAVIRKRVINNILEDDDDE